MPRLQLEDYIELLDRLLERKGLATVERDAIFNDSENINLISDAYNKRMHPRLLLKKLSMNPVHTMYASANESLNVNSLTSGQKFAVNFLSALGLTFTSTPLQLSKGILQFTDNDGTMWALFRTGYVRKKPVRDPNIKRSPWDDGKSRWQVVSNINATQYEGGGNIDDDEYMDLAEIVAEKVRKQRNKIPKDYRVSYVNNLYKEFVISIEGNPRSLTPKEIEEAVKKLYNKYVKS